MNQCLRCGKMFRDNWSLMRHFDRKRKCEIILLDVSYEEMKNNYFFLLRKINDEKLVSKTLASESLEVSKNVSILQKKSKKSKKCKKSKNEKKKYKCKYCSKTFSKRNNLYRHQKHRCDSTKLAILNNKSKYTCLSCGKTFKHKSSLCRHNLKCTAISTVYQENSDDESSDDEEKEVKIINNYYNVNNYNNFTQNIIVKDFGSEDLSYLTNQFLNKMIQGPFASIQRTNNMIHFNKEHPENMNIKITNKKDSFIKVFKKDKWCTEEKDIIIKRMIDKAMNLIDEYYAKEVKDKLPSFKNELYLKFQKAYNSCPEFKKRLHNEIEIMILNNGLSI